MMLYEEFIGFSVKLMTHSIKQYKNGDKGEDLAVSNSWPCIAKDNQIIYAIKQGTVSKSTNSGSSFQSVNTGLPTNTEATYIAISDTDHYQKLGVTVVIYYQFIMP